jgi:hypothetical protein
MIEAQVLSRDDVLVMLDSALAAHPHELRAQLSREFAFQWRPIHDRFGGHGDTLVGLTSRLGRESSAAKGTSVSDRRNERSGSRSVVVATIRRKADKAQGRIERASHEWYINADIPQAMGSGHVDIPHRLRRVEHALPDASGNTDDGASDFGSTAATGRETRATLCYLAHCRQTIPQSDSPFRKAAKSLGDHQSVNIGSAIADVQFGPAVN